MNKLLSLALLLSVLLFSACQNERSAAKWKRSGQDILIRMPQEPSGLNSLMAFDAYSTTAQRYLYQFLEDMDPHSGELRPQLLEKKPTIEMLENGGVRYDFDMHPKAVWDNGKPVTGEDYLFTLKLIMNPHIPASIFRPYLDFLDRVETDPENPRHFSVYTKRPYILAEEVITNILPVMPEYKFDPEGIMRNYSLEELMNPELRKQFEEDERLQAFAKSFTSDANNRAPEQVGGSGPYRLEEWSEGQRLVFVKKDPWWGDEYCPENELLCAYPPRITIKPVKDPSAAATLIKGEEIDIADLLNPRDFVEMRDDPKLNQIYSFEAPLTLRHYFIYINTRNPKLDDPKVRRALAHLLNTQQIIQDVFYGLGEPVSSPIFPGKDYYAKDLKPIPFDIEQAKVLLSEAGWMDTDGNGTVDKKINGQKVEMELNFLVTPNEPSKQIALLFQENAQKAGVKINIQILDFKAWRQAMNAREYELANGALSYQPVLDDLTQIWHTQSSQAGGMNRTFFGSEESDQIIEEINRTLDKKKRDKLYKIFQHMIYEYQPVINIMTARSRIAIHRRFDAFTSYVPPSYYPMLYRLEDELQ